MVEPSTFGDQDPESRGYRLNLRFGAHPYHRFTTWHTRECLYFRPILIALPPISVAAIVTDSHQEIVPIITMAAVFSDSVSLLFVHIRQSVHWQNEHRMMEHQALLPLLTFRDLVHLSMTCLLSDLNNHQLRRMAQAWPRLQVLGLHSPGLATATSAITLEGILPMLEYCPWLRKLALTINVDLHGEPSWQTFMARH
jgi:hypothetical protein